MKKTPFDCEEALGYIIKRTGRTMGKALRQKFAEHGREMPIEHWGILIHLWQRDGQSQKDLAESVFKDKATITRAIALLEKLNIVRRIPDQEDKRHKRIFLTPKGQALQQELLPLAMEVKTKATAGISDQEIEICKSVLNKIYQNLNQTRSQHFGAEPINL